MSLLIVNCFHWIGFHLVDHLLEEGYEVCGMDDLGSEKKENLSMFFGRNDSFKLISEKEESEFDTVIVVDDVFPATISSKKTIEIGFNSIEGREGQIIQVTVPILFGEWMPMSEEGIIYNDRLIPFESEEFLTEAIYINDFIQVFSQLIKASNLSNNIMVCSQKCRDSKDVSLENSIYIRDNVPIEEKVEEVKRHYQRYKDFYGS
ncbi:hypothetical protein [Ornithinibacillus halophilus]|uniref:Uncharacterized protein n=1 Tax=Ornithinibacillus halophilus TaxID=930117 RepID=A0A1M5I3Z4_9BACI|nr:hypothetical protein [Ornithinibacillus halophilus]SHG23048.1 hypothetical protein SAMN05216225_102143 [Ornithinibacillus halophilus]